MGTYRQLFSIQVGHSYFSNGEWRGLDFVPTPDTAKVIKGADMLVRKTNSGITAFYNDERTDALQQYVEAAGHALPFRFKANAGDRTFANYTAPMSPDGDAIPGFDNRHATSAPEGEKQRISKDETVSDKDLRAMDDLIAAGILCDSDRRTPPDFVVEIVIGEGQQGADGRTTSWAPQECYVNFQARSSYWRYFLLGNVGGSSPTIVDPDNRVEFEECGDVLLTGNRPARMFRSKDAIPLQEMPTSRFQLKGQGNGSAKVLIKRLPAASEGRLGIDEIGGKKEIVFENYINF